jgi:S-DNA-T family DNA segregation ATPase FtsK/SpoIIIE
MEEEKNKKTKVKEEKSKSVTKSKNDKGLVISDIKKNITAVLLIVFSLLFLLSLFEQAGIVGGFINKSLGLIFGWAKFLLPILMLVLGFVYFRKYDRYRYYLTTVGTIIFISFLASIFHYFYDLNQMKEVAQQGKGGGYLGFAISFVLVKYTGLLAGAIISLGFLLIGLILTFNFPLNRLVLGLRNRGLALIAKIKIRKIVKESESKSEEESLKDDNENEEEVNIKKGSIKFSEEADFIKSETDKNIDKKNPQSKKKTSSLIKKGKWCLPPLSLLDKPKKREEPENLEGKADLIVKTLADFGIEVYFKGYNVGPSMVQYTFEPAKGVRLSKIVTLQNNLAMSLATSSIRIEAPIPGKSLIGIELPLEPEYKEEVKIKSILESADFQESSSDLTIALGKDVYGNFILADIQKMPHLMVAGATNTGKSVCINTILTSLLYQNSPEKLKLLLIDPKRVELNFYNDIPHLAHPVIVDPSKVVKSLQWAVGEMEKRYETLEEAKVRDVRAYNKKVESGFKIPYLDEETGKKVYKDVEIMPYIIIVIDELNDLMMAYGREVESLIVRLVQKARAVGIHIIVSTQKPTVEVITGLMKANITTRIALKVASQVDSRTILDKGGAENLLGNGDMLLSDSGANGMKRIQGAFISDEETFKVVEFIKEIAKSKNLDSDSTSESLNDYLENAKNPQISGIPGISGENDEVDELFEEAKQLAISNGNLSASFVQTRLRVGYQRAARIIDELEQAGILGPKDGAKPRKLLIGSESDLEDE